MKVPSLISKSRQTFASVFLAFSVLGFLFPHHATQVKQSCQVNLKSGEHGLQAKTDDSDPQYKWFY